MAYTGVVRAGRRWGGAVQKDDGRASLRNLWCSTVANIGVVGVGRRRGGTVQEDDGGATSLRNLWCSCSTIANTGVIGARLRWGGVVQENDRRATGNLWRSSIIANIGVVRV